MVKVRYRMSTGGFQTISIPNPTTPGTPSNCLESSSSDPDILASQDISSPQLESNMLLKRENSPESPGFIVDPPNSQTQTTVLSHTIDNDYNSNSFNFSYDGSFSLSPQQTVDMKELEKGEAASVILSSQPLSNSSLSGSNASPKSFMALSISETKNDKMISGFDSRNDGLSPLSVIAVSAYQDIGHPSPNLQNSLLHRTHVLRYNPGSDTMLSALNYNESDMLQEGGFDVSSTHSFTLDGLLGTGGAPGMDLLDGDINQESYMETGQDLQLSPQSFPKIGDVFTVRENSPLTGINDSAHIKTEIKATKPSENTSNTLIVDKLKVKGTRPVKATSPNRPGTQPCPTCGKVFSNSSALTKHKLTHSDERKYVCQLCAKAFKRQDHLNGHMLTHRNKKPFECDAEGCGKSYCDARSLRRHKENHHSSASSNLPSSLSSQVSVIPGLAHLGFNSLQTSFPASVITSNSGPAFSESSLSNRIQYAPPPATTLSGHVSSANSENLSRTVSNSVVSSVISTAASHLQFLTFQQQPSSKAQQQVSSSSVKNTRSESSTVLSSWQRQTINPGALLLAQNFGASQSQSTQLISRSFETTEQGNSSGSELSQTQLLSLKQDSKKADILSQDAREQTILEQPVLSEACFEVVNSSSGTKQIVALTSQGSVNLQFESGTNTVVRLQDANGDSLYARPSMQIVKIEPPDQSNNNSSVPTTPTTKEPTNCNQIESPLLQQLLNQQQNSDTNNSGLTNSGSEQSFLTSLQEQQKSASQSSVLISPWSQVSYAAVPNSTPTSRFGQDPKPVECSLCQRKFKNIPALNGHMRLHGGYFKKENEAKKSDKKANGAHHPPLQTASTNVRALIEEKINQKRNFMPQTTVQSSTALEANPQPQGQTFNFQASQASNQPQNSNYISQVSPILSPVSQETPIFNSFPPTSQSSDLDSLTNNNFDAQSCDILKKLDLKEHFRVPHPPAEKHRRHSDSDHFIHPKRPCTTFTSSALADLLRSRVVAKRTCRTGSDPGESLSLDTPAFTDFTDSLSSVSVNDLPKFSSLVPSSLGNAMDDTSSDLPQHDLTAITPEDAALPVLSAEDIPEAQPMIMGMRDISELDTQCLERNVFFDTSNNDLGVSQTFPEISVSELEMMQFTSVPTSSAPTSSEVKPVNGEKARGGEDSNDDDVFLSPTSLPTSPMKLKKKRRPEPLYIPPYVNTCGFTSRLRSPRLWDPSNPDHKKLSPPPYTPPPMLSPVRSGSGLFWHIISGSGSLTPKSAPITPSFGLGRKASTGGESTPETEEELTEVPESDILPHVNIGSNYQAKIPPFNPNFKDALLVEHKADRVWDPLIMDSTSEEEVNMYLELSCCAVIPGGGRNKEYALHLFQICKGNIKDAILHLMDSGPKLPPNHPLLTYQYSENDRWSPEEIEAYHQGLLRCDKDFFNIAKDIPSKSVKQCIQFYYLWKKVCPDEYKRLRLIRRRKEQESLYYNLRSKEESQETEEKPPKRNVSPPSSITRRNTPEDTSEKRVTVNGSTKSSDANSTIHSSTSLITTSTYNGSAASSAYDFTIEPMEEFPCKICGKVFSKVKSRSAHMKSHKQDNERKNMI